MNDRGKKHIIGLLVENEPGVLSRVVGLFSQRGYNIESLSVATTQDPSLSRITITTYGAESIIEQITKQLNKVVPVYKVMEISESRFIEREVGLIKIRTSGDYRAEIKRMADIFGAKIVDVTATTYTLEFTGRGKDLDAFLNILESSHILECARSGIVGMTRGDKGISVKARETEK